MSNVEQGMSNYEVLSLLFLAVPILFAWFPRWSVGTRKDQICPVPSTFIIPCSIFDIQKNALYYPINYFLITSLYCTQLDLYILFLFLLEWGRIS